MVFLVTLAQPPFITKMYQNFQNMEQILKKMEFFGPKIENIFLSYYVGGSIYRCFGYL